MIFNSYYDRDINSKINAIINTQETVNKYYRLQCIYTKNYLILYFDKEVLSSSSVHINVS